MKETLALVLALCMVFALCACGQTAAPAASAAPATSAAPAADPAAEATPDAKADPIVFSCVSDLSSDRPPYVEMFAKLVEEKTEGRYVGNVLAGGSLGGGADCAQMLQMGTLDILMSDDMTMDGVLDGALGFAWLPGLVSDFEEADAYYNFGWIADQIAKIMAENDIIRISSFCNGFRQVGNVTRPITEMSDFVGLKIRTPSVPAVVDFYERCGALPVMISSAEVLNALQTKTVDGLDNAIFNYNAQGVNDVIKYITELNYCYSGGCFMAGAPFWSTLSEEDQAIFRECAQEASDAFIEFYREETATRMQLGVDNGQWVISQPSDDMKAQMQEISKAIWESSVDMYGHEIMDVIISGEYKELSK